jgi:hypothetical protein
MLTQSMLSVLTQPESTPVRAEKTGAFCPGYAHARVSRRNPVPKTVLAAVSRYPHRTDGIQRAFFVAGSRKSNCMASANRILSDVRARSSAKSKVGGYRAAVRKAALLNRRRNPPRLEGDRLRHPPPGRMVHSIALNIS